MVPSLTGSDKRARHADAHAAFVELFPEVDPDAADAHVASCDDDVQKAIEAYLVSQQAHQDLAESMARGRPAPPAKPAPRLNGVARGLTIAPPPPVFASSSVTLIAAGSGTGAGRTATTSPRSKAVTILWSPPTTQSTTCGICSGNLSLGPNVRLKPCEHAHHHACLIELHASGNFDPQTDPRCPQCLMATTTALFRRLYPEVAAEMEALAELERDAVDPRRPCGVCGEPVRVSHLIPSPCSSEAHHRPGPTSQDDLAHAVCVECFVGAFDATLHDRVRFRCPGSDPNLRTGTLERCSYEMRYDEVKACVEAAERIRLAVAFSLSQLETAASDEERDQADDARRLQEYALVETQAAIQTSSEFVSCAGVECHSGVMLELGRAERVRIDCNECSFCFCSDCRAPWHHSTPCASTLRVRMEWQRWKDTGKTRYLESMAQASAEHAAALERHRAELVVRRREVEPTGRTLRAFLDDERYKAKKCRYCSMCNRVLEHMGGCDLIVCGRDYHGGSNQQGCGANLRWSTLRLYAPAVAFEVPEDVLPRAPERAGPVKHLVWREEDGSGDARLCGLCLRAIEGPRFDCIQRPDLSACIACEPQLMRGEFEKLDFRVWLNPTDQNTEAFLRRQDEDEDERAAIERAERFEAARSEVERAALQAMSDRAEKRRRRVRR